MKNKKDNFYCHKKLYQSGGRAYGFWSYCKNGNKSNKMTKDIKEKAIEWFNDIAELCGKLTSGNVSHLAATIKGKAIRSAEYIEKHCCDSPWISVEDELPPYGEVVIVHCKDESPICENFSHRTEDVNVVKDNHDFCIYCDEIITHWMPIPKLNEK